METTKVIFTIEPKQVEGVEGVGMDLQIEGSPALVLMAANDMGAALRAALSEHFGADMPTPSQMSTMLRAHLDEQAKVAAEGDGK